MTIPFFSACDNVSRIKIMKEASNKATDGNFYRCTYFGDGGWDQKACKELGYKFFYIGTRLKHQPNFTNYKPISQVLPCVGL